jgi:F-type H+-transporting ATPase subunit delta
MAEKHTIARPYAEAVFELARKQDALDAWSGALGLAGGLMADGQVADFLASPSLSDDERLKFVTAMASNGRLRLSSASPRLP